MTTTATVDDHVDTFVCSACLREPGRIPAPPDAASIARAALDQLRAALRLLEQPTLARAGLYLAISQLAVTETILDDYLTARAALPTTTAPAGWDPFGDA